MPSSIESTHVARSSDSIATFGSHTRAREECVELGARRELSRPGSTSGRPSSVASVTNAGSAVPGGAMSTTSSRSSGQTSRSSGSTSKSAMPRSVAPGANEREHLVASVRALHRDRDLGMRRHVPRDGRPRVDVLERRRRRERQRRRFGHLATRAPRARRPRRGRGAPTTTIRRPDSVSSTERPRVAKSCDAELGFERADGPAERGLGDGDRRGRLQSSSPRLRSRRRSGAAADSCRNVIVHLCVRSWTGTPSGATRLRGFVEERGSGHGETVWYAARWSGTRLRLAVVALVVVAAVGTLSLRGRRRSRPPNGRRDPSDPRHERRRRRRARHQRARQRAPGAAERRGHGHRAADEPERHRGELHEPAT